jgi:hypothetical protein
MCGSCSELVVDNCLPEVVVEAMNLILDMSLLQGDVSAAASHVSLR